MQDLGEKKQDEKKRGLRERDRVYQIDSDRANLWRFVIWVESNDLALV
jgi:hypothetical protein